MTTFALLGDLVSIQRGTTYKSALLGQPGPVLLGLASIARNGGFRGDSLRTYGGESPPQLLVRPGELFASLKDVTQAGDLLGSVARVPAGGQVGRLTQDTVRLDVHGSVDRDFLYYALLTPAYRQWCRSHATGTTNLGLPRDDFLAYPVWLPSLSQQRKIAGALNALDDLVGSLEGAMQQMDELGVCLFRRSWVGEERPLAEVAQLTMGQSPPGSSYNDQGEGLPFHQGIRDFGDRHPRTRVWTTAGNRLARAGDVLLAVRAPVGAINVALEEMALGRGLAGLHGDRPSTLLHALRANPRLWDRYQGDGTVFASVNKATVSGQLIPWVDSDALEEALQALDKLYARCWREVADVRATRDELLPLLMSGRIRVEDVAA